MCLKDIGGATARFRHFQAERPEQSCIRDPVRVPVHLHDAAHLHCRLVGCSLARLQATITSSDRISKETADRPHGRMSGTAAAAAAVPQQPAAGPPTAAQRRRPLCGPRQHPRGSTSISSKSRSGSRSRSIISSGRPRPHLRPRHRRLRRRHRNDLATSS